VDARDLDAQSEGLGLFLFGEDLEDLGVAAALTCTMRSVSVFVDSIAMATRLLSARSIASAQALVTRWLSSSVATSSQCSSRAMELLHQFGKGRGRDLALPVIAIAHARFEIGPLGEQRLHLLVDHPQSAYVALARDRPGTRSPRGSPLAVSDRGAVPTAGDRQGDATAAHPAGRSRISHGQWRSPERQVAASAFAELVQQLHRLEEHWLEVATELEAIE